MNVRLHATGPTPFRWLSKRIAAWGIKKGILKTPYSREDIERRIRSAGLDIMETSATGNVLRLIARKPEV